MTPMLFQRSAKVLSATLAFMAMSACTTTTFGSTPRTTGTGHLALSEALAVRDGDPSIEIANLSDGDVVSSPVRVEVFIENMILTPAGSTKDGHGHWNLLIDRGCHAPGQRIPQSADVAHVDSGDTHVSVELPPGRHELCVQFGDGFHVAVDVSDTVGIEVAD